ncbi:MAG: formate dehydrogenase accessory sulfurtransferase FdhD [Candidatus Ozemobacteraceae bacterium]
MKICSWPLEEFEKKAVSFHGRNAPGLLIGGFMVDLASRNLPAGEFFDVICESGKCLPDAVQILTPCSIGNGWLRILKIGRFAMTFFEKQSGMGVRVFLDTEKLEQWTEIKNWFFRLVPKAHQNTERLMEQIKEAGIGILSLQKVNVDVSLFQKRKGKKVSVCSRCHEGFPSEHGTICRVCGGEINYLLLPHIQKKNMLIDNANTLEDIEACCYENGILTVKSVPLIQEKKTPVIVNGIELARLLALDIELEELVLGFLFTECFIAGPEDVTRLTVDREGWRVIVDLKNPLPLPLSDHVEFFTNGGRGRTFLAKKAEKEFRPVNSTHKVTARTVISLMKELQGASELFRATGGVHSAALVQEGKIIKISEDIGRHNALDKVIGYALRHQWPISEDSMLLSTGRLSSETIVKAARARIPLLVSHSAPTLGAVQLAQTQGITLIGFSRGDKFIVYSHPERVTS